MTEQHTSGERREQIEEGERADGFASCCEGMAEKFADPSTRMGQMMAGCMERMRACSASCGCCSESDEGEDPCA